MYMKKKKKASRSHFLVFQPPIVRLYHSSMVGARVSPPSPRVAVCLSPLLHMSIWICYLAHTCADAVLEFELFVFVCDVGHCSVNVEDKYTTKHRFGSRMQKPLKV